MTVALLLLLMLIVLMILFLSKTQGRARTGKPAAGSEQTAERSAWVRCS